eukprot:scaffold94482_cov58-Phaeocystis_antarctica.AAC.1
MPHHTQLHQLRASTQHRHRRQRRGSSRRRHWRRHRRRLAAVAEARIRPTCSSLVAILGLPRCLGWAPGAAEGRRDELDDSGYHVEPVAHEHVGGHRAPNTREGGAVRRVHVRQVAEDFPLKVHLGQQHQQHVGARRDVLEQADHVLHDGHDARRDERTRVREEAGGTRHYDECCTRVV